MPLYSSLMSSATDHPQIELSEQQALDIVESKAWERMTDVERATVQLLVNQCIMPLDVFQEALQSALGRGVFTHEIGLNRRGLLEELRGNVEAPDIDTILDMVPGSKLVAATASE